MTEEHLYAESGAHTQIATILIIFLTSIGFLAIRCKLIDPAVPLDARRNYPLDFIFQTTVNPFSLPVSVKLGDTRKLNALKQHDIYCQQLTTAKDSIDC
uniref:Uncharacterized protein n=1 Tax=Glossina palpalis gambiensis TaxID=67801 RepID=A0A1B0BCA6_9MUSC